MTKADINEFFATEIWDRIKAHLEERHSAALRQLIDPDKDDQRHAARAKVTEIEHFLTIREVIEQDLKEESNG